MNNKKECNPNHCSALRQSAESILRLELRLKEALDHIKEKELQECDYVVKIKKIEEQNEKLIKDLTVVYLEKNKLEEQNKELREALLWFCNRVDLGEVRSKRTYARFKELLTKS